MKTIFLAGLVTFTFAIQAQAVVADRFICKMKVTDLESKMSTHQDFDFQVARLPVPPADGNDPVDPKEIRRTQGQSRFSASLDTGEVLVKGDLNFYYVHVVRNGNHGLEARQNTCIGLSGTFCEKGTGSDKGPCVGYSNACLFYADPFDPVHGWTPTGLNRKIPNFNPKELGPVTEAILDSKGQMRGEVSLSCAFKGTHY